MSFVSALTGSFSSPAAENPTVVMMEAAYRHHGIDARYLNCDVSATSLPDAIRGAVAMDWVGFNLSMPHKVAVLDHLDGLDDSAEIIGAVNCVVREGERLIGHNTDGQGFITSLRSVADPSGAHVTLFGAGGAARAIAVELGLAGAATITIVNRDSARAGQLATLVNERTEAAATTSDWRPAHEVAASSDIVVNATSIGLLGNPDTTLDLAVESLQSHMVVADVIPNPPRTRLMSDAAERGAVVLDGLGMLVNQGMLGIRHWFGIDADAAVMRESLDARFST